jgi:hypothetical protein
MHATPGPNLLLDKVFGPQLVMLLSQGAFPAMAWGPYWKEYLKSHKTITFSDRLLEVGLTLFYVFSHRVWISNNFWTSLLPYFWSQGRQKGRLLRHFGREIQYLLGKSWKVKTGLSLETAHHDQAFQGLCLTMIYHLLLRVVETYNVNLHRMHNKHMCLI